MSSLPFCNIAAKIALEKAKEYGWSKFWLESDSHLVMQAFN